jgi:preprotein translocase subunit Sec61beta
VSEQRPGDDGPSAISRRGSWLRTVRAVAWSFFGIRKGAEYEKDVAQLNPLHVVIAGVAIAALFVIGLVVLVKWIVGSGLAAG